MGLRSRRGWSPLFVFDVLNADIWNFQAFLEKAKNDSLLSQSLLADRNIFFLHLLGLDTNGHGKKPYSKEYIENIAGLCIFHIFLSEIIAALHMV